MPLFLKSIEDGTMAVGLIVITSVRKKLKTAWMGALHEKIKELSDLINKLNMFKYDSRFLAS